MNIQQLESLYDLFSMGYERAESEFGKGFPAYFLDLFRYNAHVKKYVEKTVYFFNKLDAHGKRVADCGCGYGTRTLLFRIFGANEAWGIEIEKDMVETLHRFKELIQPTLTNVYITRANAENLPFKTGRMDVITAFDSISHMGDPISFFKEAYRVLKPGGKLFVDDGNSSLDVPGQITRRRYWKKREYGPWDFEKYYLKDSESSEPYADQRKNIIKRFAPYLPAHEVNHLVTLTRGMWQPEIIRAIEEYQNSGKVTYKPQFHCKDPISGETAERAFNPFSLMKRLSLLGFETKLCRPFYITRHPIKKYIAKLFRWTYPLSLPLISSFSIIAER